MKIRVLAIGKIKEKYLKEAIAEYAKRLRPYLKLEILEGPEEEAPQNLSAGDAARILEREGRFFLEKMRPGDFNIALDLAGEMITSPGLAALVEEKVMEEGKTINFLIGGSLGLDGAVKNQCQRRIAFGRATFPHQLIRVFLVEQIYRSLKIIRNEPYHK